MQYTKCPYAKDRHFLVNFQPIFPTYSTMPDEMFNYTGMSPMFSIYCVLTVQGDFLTASLLYCLLLQAYNSPTFYDA